MCDTGWFTSTYSGAGNDNCVEVRMIGGQSTGVRDSKNPQGDVLWIRPTTWARFVASSSR